MSEYTFLKTRYENAPLLISPDGKYVRRRTVGSTARIVFLGQAIEYNNKLVLRVEATSDSSNSHFSFVFGVSTCDITSVNKNDCHAKAACTPTGPCGGSSVTFHVTSCERIGYFAYFERLHTSFIVVTIGKKSFPMWDLGGVFDGRRAYPFLMLTGSVGALRIISESDIPILSPIGSRRMSARQEVRFQVRETGQRKQENSRPARDRSASAPDGEWRSSASDYRRNSQQAAEAGTVQMLTPQHILRQLGALKVTPSIQKWISSDTIAHEVDDMTESIKRTGSADEKNYTIRMEPFDIQKSISFKVVLVEASVTRTMTFGVTRNNPEEVNFNGLPLDPVNIMSSSFNANWFLKPDILTPPIPENMCVSFTRTMAGIIMRTSDNFTDQVVIEVDPTITLYSFFCFNGSVKAITFLKEFRIRNQRQGGECIACPDTYSCHFGKPCKHLVFCEECLVHAKLSRFADNCPICRSKVEDYDRVFF